MKRIIFSIILALFCVIFSNKLWLDIKPVQINFTISGSGDYRIAAVLNKKNDNKFVNIKSEYSDIKLSGEKENINIEIKNVKTAKRLKFRFMDKGGLNKSITLSNIQLNGNQIEINKPDVFEGRGVDLRINNGNIVLIPQTNKFQILYKKPIHINSSKNIDWFLLISLSVLTFLLSYKLASYIADFKTAKQQSRIEIIFLTVFFILLFIPMSYINPSEKSKTENRYLATLKPFIIQNQINYDFGKNVNEWFNDRFCGRNAFINANVIINCALNKNFCKNTRFNLDKKHNFIKDRSLFGLETFGGFTYVQKEYTEEEVLKLYAANVQKFSDYCKSKNIKLYFLIVPRRADYFNFEYFDKRQFSPDPADKPINYLKDNTDANIIYLKEALNIANEKSLVFFKTDFHWTKWGAYTGYYELMKSIKKDFPNVPVLEESSLEKYYDKRVQYWWNSEFMEGQMLKQMNLPKFLTKNVLDTNYLYYKNPNASKLKTGLPGKLNDLTNFDEEFFYSDGADLKVMLIANSYGRNLVEFLPYSFKHTLRLYDNYRFLKFKEYEKLINEYKPDIIVININTFVIYTLLNLYIEEFVKGNTSERGKYAI